MDSKVKELMYSSGVNEKLSKLLIGFTGGDVEGARKIINAMPKNYFAIKIRYMAHKTHYYGVFLLVADINKKSLDDIYVIVDKNTAASQIDNSKKYEEFKEEIVSYIKNNNPNQEIMRRFREKIDSNDFIQKLFSKLTNDEFDIEQLKSVFSELFSKILTEQSCAIKIDTEKVDIFSIHKSNHDYKFNEEGKERKDDESKSEEVHIRNISLVILRVEPVVAPVMGIPANELQVNDQILVKIIDDREIGDYLLKLLNGKNAEGEYLPVPSTIMEIDKQEDTDNLMILTEFGPGIAGKMYISPEIKVEIPGLEDENVSEGSGFSKVNPIWIIVTLIIVFFIIFIFTVVVGR